MKKANLFEGWGWVLILAIVFSACSGKDYNITQVLVDSGKWVPTYDASGKQLPDNHRQADTSYKVEPSHSQKHDLAKANNALGWFYFFLVLTAASALYSIISTINPKRGGWQAVVFGLLAVVLLGCAYSSINWAVTKEGIISKPVYDSLMKKDGNLGAYWKENLFK